MRLLHTQTLGLEPFFNYQTRPPYAVLSHTWEVEHPRYSEFSKNAASGPGSTFVRRACAAAQHLGYQYVWVASFCVDASSEAEVSEAINSGYRWFQEAAACLVYLADLPSGDADEDVWRQCKWWTRAWTLPELLAPSAVRFYDSDWNFRGTKISTPLLGLISRITTVSEDVLCDSSLVPQVSIAKRMSWTANRKAWRVEDRAYSLLGIFGVHMQAVYGEGTASFLRLQNKILEHTRDMSLLAWEAHPGDDRPFRGLLASSPVEFARFTSCPPKWTKPLVFEGEIQHCNEGLSITGPFFSYPSDGRQVLLLDLGVKNSAPHSKAALVLFRYGDCFVRAASNAAGTLKGPATPVAMKVSAARDLTAQESNTIFKSLSVPIFSSWTTIPSGPGSNVSSPSRNDTDAGSESSMEEDLSIFDEDEPVLEERHPFLAVMDDLTKTALSGFRTCQNTGPLPSGKRFFACPFRARDPTRYTECPKLATLRNPCDVKRHIWQEHRLPNYCPVCYAVFDTASECSEHIVQRTCEHQLRPHIDGVSEDQKELLKRRDRSSASREERWLAIWDIIFPGDPPLSPFPDGCEDRAAAEARKFWEGRGKKIVAGFLEERGLLSWDIKDEERALAAVHKLVGGRLVERVFDDAWVFANRTAIA